MTPSSRPRTNRKPRILVLESGRSAANCISRAGGEPIVRSPRSTAVLDELLDLPVDGVLLTGGADVDPALYGEKRHPKVYGVNEVRDFVELSMLDRAAYENLPVMGICRGMQLMAVHNGGRLKQHVAGHRGCSHGVYAEPGSLYRRTTRSTLGIFVSLHHQRVVRHGRGWRTAGRDSSGGIEAIESLNGRCLGVQYHPEMDYFGNDQSRRLFRWLVVESAKRAGLPIPRSQRLPAARPPLPRATGTPSQYRRPQLSLLPDPAPEPRRSRPRAKPVASRWFCRDCGLEFDKQQDRDDHEYWICGTPTMRVTEPPPGHPDWMGAK